jgi:anti-sigma regulatory factor (Ser/Thr protein kinase)
MTSSTTLCLDGGLEAPAEARRWVLGHEGWHSRRRRDDVALMLCEVVTNAVLHGGVGPGTELRIDVAADDRAITFRVYDRGEGFRPEARAGPPRRRGWGLYIVDRLAHRWGIAHVPGGACVWFEALRDGGGHG